ncbi:hypothetical protein ACJIZ3_012634 [Penstemon smallii]|uniref:poly(ADP-ribose) glycohydrolase n=1 Tax=Penstemon smallii TaxID=265156 RepID=A0ABD3UNR2_9LAMI
MESSRKDFQSILPFLPLISRSSAIYWPPAVLEAFKFMSKGPIYSNVNSGQTLSLAITDFRNSHGYPSLHPSAPLGFSLFFDDLMSKDEARMWFGEVVPRLADLLLKLPELLENHYKKAEPVNGMETALRLLEPQQSGIVLLGQELVAALLVCSLFCLFPTTDRYAKHLPPINFDELFVSLYESYDVKQEHKIKCIIHYFEKICSSMPMGSVSFERKVLSNVFYPEAAFWSKSTKPLCQFEVSASGLIENHSTEALEVDFANKNIGGGALGRGCVQEEIRFMINPELIVSMLFLPSMADNESIEIIGAERFSDYTGYAASFRFCGDYADKKGVDSLGRRKTRIIAIDALSRPGKKQYRLDYLVRETNKAFCGFLNQDKCQQNQTLFGVNGLLRDDQNNEDEIGIATGNWGCGAFGGDPEVKAVIQWLAASEARRPFILYYTFGLEQLEKLQLIVQWIVSQKWTVGELWNILVEYSTQRLKGKTKHGLFNWLLPSIYNDFEPMMLDTT